MVLELNIISRIAGGNRAATALLKALSNRPRGRRVNATFIITFDLQWEGEWAGIRRRGTVKGLQLRVSARASNIARSAQVINDRLSRQAYRQANTEITREMEQIRNDKGQQITIDVWESSGIDPTLTRQPVVIARSIRLA